MNLTKVAYCNCSHAFQDALYGFRQRLMIGNQPNARTKQTHYICTVCGEKKGK